MKKLSTVFAKVFEQLGIKCAFGISGGAILHFVDSLCHETSIKTIFSTNEMFSAFEADGVSRCSNSVGLCFATSGPGMSNLITGIATSYYDSVKTIVVTGQVSSKRRNTGLNIKQYGFQEAENCKMMESISIYNATINKDNYRQIIQDICHLLQSKKQGPIHIEFPDDIQRHEVEITDDEISILISTSKNTPGEVCEDNLEGQINNISKLIQASNKPIVLLGAGCRKLNIEQITALNCFIGNSIVVSTWGGISIAKKFPNYAGCIGTYSSLKCNKFLSECDLLMSIGSRLSNNIIGSKSELFCQKAHKIIVDIDSEELKKPTISGWHNSKSTTLINTSVEKLCAEIQNFNSNNRNIDHKKDNSSWSNLSDKNNADEFEYSDIASALNKIVDNISPDEKIFIDTGLSLAWSCNIFSENPKCIAEISSAWNYTPMGYALPAAIGYSIVSNHESSVVIGDGGFLLCMSELALVSHHNLALQIYLIDNNGHSIQKQTIECWLNSRYSGVSPKTGLPTANFEYLAKAFSIDYYDCDPSNLNEKILESDKRKTNLFRIQISEEERCYPVAVFGKELGDPIYGPK